MKSHDEWRDDRSMVDTGNRAFIPEYYTYDSQQALLEYVGHHPLCQMVTTGVSGLMSSAVPLIPDPRDEHRFVGHLAARNPQAAAIHAGAEVLALFTGPQAYVSPRWFVEKKTVPTWNYLSVQLRGRLTSVDHDEAHNIMSITATHMEALVKAQNREHVKWGVDEADDKLYGKLMRGIVAFHVSMDSLEGIRRLGQDKSLADIKSIMAGLSTLDGKDSPSMVDLMAEQYASYL